MKNITKSIKKQNKFMQNSYKKRKKHLDEKEDFS